MTDQLISFETAKLAKEKGFNITGCTSRYWNNTLVTGANIQGVAAPTQSLLQKWLREVHNIHMFVSITTNDIFLCRILNPLFKNGSEGRFIICKMCNTYEEALEQGLIEALKLIQ